ncbi:MAG TPA: tRNA (adenosine(37)-N6)-dimethylallyltransferase MiaA, partial [Gaiellales bacterium]|nr:tRNA (adenosine(37)-N6)-dimethylallyltransferase MiaA [Gaiellales bacterium]
MTVVAVFGPTASGKSAVALALADLIGGEIVSCDAMQLYRGLPILTNQPTAPELERVAHHLVAVWPLSHAGSVAEYAALAHAAIDEVAARGRVPVVVGGSGLYLRAALAAMALPPRPRAGARERQGALYDRVGARAAHDLLGRVDARAAAAVHPNDRRRVVRALELAAAGVSLAPARDTLWTGALRRPAVVVGLRADPAEVARRIQLRTETMFAAGVEAEVARATSVARLSHTAARIHGLQDVSALLRGEIDRAEAVRRLVVRTRRY